SKGAGAAAQIVRHDVILAPLPDEALNRAFAPRQNSFKGDRRGLRLAIVPGRMSRTDHKRNFMRKTLLASTCLAAMAAMPAHAETTISTATTTPVKTSTVKSGAPDDIKITKDGSIKPAAGTAVTIDSNHKVVNEGTIEIVNKDGATGISANAGVTGSITNGATGKIIINETYAPTDIDNDGDIDGPFAV